MSGHSFFEFREKLTPPRAPRAAPAAPDPASSLTVSQVTKLIDKAVRGGTPASLNVRGQVSNFKHNQSSGHAYFTLKDADACISCVMFRGEFERVKFRPEDGVELLATGNVRVFAAQGKYQLYVSALQPLGQGALELAFQQLRAKLEAEGLFSADRKRKLPRYPSRILLITSRETAALQDILKVLRRYPSISLVLAHVPVQGEGCGRQIAAAVTFVNKYRSSIGNPDLILLGRGGGSLEDLWGFNDEQLARAIYASDIPVVTGIGHEVDTSIADLVADHHAHTPTEAASVATSHWQKIHELLPSIQNRLQREILGAVQNARHRLNAVTQHEIFRRPTDRLDDLRVILDDRQQSLQLAAHSRLRGYQQRLLSLNDRLQRQTPAAQLTRATATLHQSQQRLLAAVQLGLRRRREALETKAAKLAEHHPRALLKLQDSKLTGIQDRLRRAGRVDLQQRSTRVSALAVHLEALSPQRVLERGYTVTRFKKGGTIVRDAAELKDRDRIITRFHDGETESIVQDPNQPKLFE